MRIVGTVFLLCVLYSFSLAEEDQATVPVRLAIEPFYELIIESRAYELDAASHKIGSSSIEAGGLHLGSINYSMHPFQEVAPEGFRVNSSHVTVHNVTVINNSKPFRLAVNVVGVASNKKNILELKDKDSAELSALKVKIKNDAVTRYPEHVSQSEEWQAFRAGEPLIVYRSHGKIVSDIVNVEMAIVNIDPATKSDVYGGQLIWTLESEV